MANLYTSLSTASRALEAQHYGLDVAGQNIANVNTPGYSRRTVDLAAIPPDGAGLPGRGVDVVGVRSMRDLLLERRLRQEVPAHQREGTIANSLSVVEAALGTPGSSIDRSLQNFFDAFSRLAEQPTSATVRQDVLTQTDQLASAFRNMAERLTTARRNSDLQIRSAAEEANTLTEQIAQLNASIGRSPSAEGSLHLRDTQAQLVRQLTDILDVQVLERPDGGVDIATAGGRPLVVGESQYAITVSSVGPAGYASLAINGATITSDITGGRIGGLLEVRDVHIPAYMSQLDDLAWNVADQINTLHAAGYDQSGTAAGDLFDFSTAPVGTAGAAAALIVDAGVAADPSLLAAAGIADGGDNGNARDIAALREQRVLSGNTATLGDAWGTLVYRVASDVRRAGDERDSRNAIVAQVEALRDEVSGVSLDEEAMHLLKFQRAYEANARFFSAVDQTLQVLLNNLGG